MGTPADQDISNKKKNMKVQLSFQELAMRGHT